MMGAMIMLLVVAARDVRESANASPSEIADLEITDTPTLTLEEAEELRYKIEASSDDVDWYAENFRLARQKAEEELADYQARLAHAETATQKIRDELARLEQLARQLDTETPAVPEEVEHLKRLLAQQQQRLTDAELELAELQQEAAQMKKSYAIVPTRHANGTFRRPIYIECRDNKIILQPEGVELGPADFQALDEPANPFNTVLRTIRQYYTETGQVARGSEPYPLLIVRPTGIEMYENALTATGDWVRDFGYEIVNEDWDIQYPEPSDELRRRIQQQLEIARDRLSGYLMARRLATPMQGYGSDMSQHYRVDHRGNIVPTGGGLQANPLAPQEAEARRQQGSSQQGSPQQGTSQQGPPLAGQEAETRRPLGTPLTGREAAARRQQGSPQQGSPQQGSPQQGSPLAEQEATARQQQGHPSAPSEADASTGHPGTASAEQQMMPRPTQTVQPRPQNWGLKGVTQFSTSMSRAVLIRCEADRLILPVQAGLREEQVIPIGDSVSAAADQLVLAIWEFQESWGSAGANMHWRPILQVRVSPGGEWQLQELKLHLRSSGLVIEE